MVYISSSTLNASMRASVVSAQSELAKAQTELSSGTYADLGLQLGGASGQVLLLSQQQSRLQAFTSGNTAAATRLTSTDKTLTSLQTTATSFLSALTEAQTAGGLKTGLQVTAAGDLQSLIAGLNTSVGGQAIFGGINTDVAPIASYTSGSASKTAVDAAFSSAFGTSQTGSGASTVTASQMSDFLSGSFAGLFDASSFSSTWSTASDTTQTTEIAQGQTVTSSVSANALPFRQLAQAYTIINEFTTGSSLSDAAQQSAITAAAGLVNQALSGLTGIQAGVGVAQSTITSVNDQISLQSSLLSSQSDALQATDVYALNTRIVSLQTQIQASYELTSQLQKLSLVNYLG